MKLIHSDLLKFAFEFANQSKKILKNNYFKKFSVEEKDDGSLVTNIDKEIEERFREKLKKNFHNTELLVKSLEMKKKTMSLFG